MITLSTSFQSLPPAFELRDADRVVGWINGDSVRFLGFGSKRNAAQAATIAHRAMMRRIASRGRAMPSATETDRSVVRRSADRANTPADGRPVASVLRSHTNGLNGSDSVTFEFEIRVPQPTDEIRMRGMAYVMYRALRSSGVAWPLLRPGTPRESLRAMVTHTAVTDSGASSDGNRGGSNVFERLAQQASRSWALSWGRTHHAR